MDNLQKDKMYILGDTHTVTAFKISGIEGIISDIENIADNLDLLKEKEDAGIIIITQSLAKIVTKKIKDINLNMVKPVIIEIPGIDDTGIFEKSILNYISEALGVSI
jgi:vacuolar-type H+-ATPase subunit F/Vma7